MRSFVVAHGSALALSLFVGAIVVAPQIIFIMNASDYQGVYMMRTDAEVHYLARMNNFVHTYSIGNPYLFEEKETLSSFHTISEGILALPAIFLPISVANLSLAYKFILPAIVFFLAYLLFLNLSESKKWAITFAVAFVLGQNLVNVPDIINLLRLNVAYYGHFLMFARPVNPQFSTILLLVYLLALLAAMKSREPRYFVFLGLLFGLSFYIYLYSFTFLAALQVVCLIVFAIRKEYQLVGRLFLSFLLGICLGAYELISILAIYSHPYYQGMAAMSDVVASHEPILSTAGIVTAAIFTVYVLFSKRARIIEDVFILGLLLTSFVVINQQILTGITIQTGHYHWYFNSLVYLITLFWAFYCIFRECATMERLQNVFLGLLCAVFAFSAIFTQYASYLRWKDDTLSEQRMMPAISWLKQNASQAVVLANVTISEKIPVFTNNYVAWAPYSVYYLIPEERRSLTPDLIVSGGIDQYMQKYRLDYILWDKVNEPEWAIDKLSGLQPLYSENDIIIYGFK